MLRFGPKKKDVPDGLFIKCDGCGAMVYRKHVEELENVCPECKYHFRIGAWERVRLHTDEGSFQEIAASLRPCDPLNFVAGKAYKEVLKKDAEKSGLTEAIICGTCTIEGRPAVFSAMDFRFRGASMGSVVGEKLTRAIELAGERHLPLVVVATSGGARMQEGALSLMQMAKTCAALNRFSSAGGVFISVLTNPTMAGVLASWASMGDVIMAEPGALIGFTGPRVIRETIRQELPPGFQTSEFLLEHGFLDMIVERKDIKPTVARLLSYFCRDGV